MSRGDLVLTLAIMGVFGATFTVIKLGLEGFPPLFLLFLRYLLVALLLVPFAPVPSPRKLRNLLFLSVTLGGLHFPLLFLGLGGIDAATAAIASQLQVPFSSLLAALVFRDMLGWRRATGMLLALVGVGVMAGEPRLADNLGSLALVVVSSLLFAVASIQIKSLGAISLFSLNGWMTLFAAPQVLTLSLLLEEGQGAALAGASWTAWAAIFYLVVPLTMFAHGNWYRLINRYPVNQTAPFLLLAPMFGVVSAVLVLGEPLTWPLLAGGVLTVGGVAVIVLRSPVNRPPEPAAVRTVQGVPESGPS